MERRQFIIGAGATALGATAVGPTAAEAAETGRAAGWNSNFTTNNLGWSRVSGAWYRSGGMWRADGLPGYWTSTKHTNVYENFVYQAKVKRDGNGGGYYNNSLVIRGNPASLNSAYEWSPSYIFGFTNTGSASVWRVNYDGTETAIMGWTYFPFLTSLVWKNMKVVAQDNFFSFAIGGRTLWSGYDSNLAYGRVGFTFYTASSYWSTLRIDSASLQTLAAREKVTLDPMATGGRVLKGGNSKQAPA